jgi:hypothetical protein
MGHCEGMRPSKAALVDGMRSKPQFPSIVILIFALTALAAGQTSTVMPGDIKDQPQLAEPPAMGSDAPAVPADSVVTSSVQPLLDFKDSDVKFDLHDLLDTLRDRRHEGWVLAAYPDPKTHGPLIGAGFSLDLPAREHPQRDPLNPHPFLEPSSAELWHAAGLDPQRLQNILDQFHDRFPAPIHRRYRIRIGTLPPEISDQDATQLLRISAIQAIYNAKAYCRNFDQLTASQQMALSQLVYQMGVNLDEFSEFLGLINTDPGGNGAAAAGSEYWRGVQQSLIQSQWARLYRTRAISVIAMFDPQYLDDPVVAEKRITATLRPAVMHRSRGRRRELHQLAGNSGSRKRALRKKASGTGIKRRA